MDNNKKSNSLISYVVMFALLFTIYKGYCYLGYYWADSAAETAVKSEVFKREGRIPKMDSECIYDGGNKVLVIVKYKIPETNRKGSYALAVHPHMFNATVSGMSNHMSYDFNHESRIEEWKAVFRIK